MIEPITEILYKKSMLFPEKVLFVSLETGIETNYTYSRIEALVASKTRYISSFDKAKYVLLVYNDTIDFITSFLACQRSGIIPIPMFYPKNKRHFERLVNILNQSGSELIFCSEADQDKIANGVQTFKPGIRTIKIPFEPVFSEKSEGHFSPDYQETAFIQYTSGSTSSPKGVIVTHENVLHNQRMIVEVFNCDEHSVILSWLPFYHDMGLIGNLLHTIYSGCTCVLMRSYQVVSQPVSWLKAIDHYKVTHSGGPNFIYDLCLDHLPTASENLNLSSWKVAYNGSEPVQTETIQRFTKQFERFGFKHSSFYTCYGLAESTLIVSGGLPQFKDHSPGSGNIVSGLKVVFQQPETNEFSMVSGEICIHGKSVTPGYLHMDSSPFFVAYQGEHYFKTGDLGFTENNQLFINGRLKEMLILNGKNIFPYDLEQAIAASTEIILKNGVGIAETPEGLLVVAECKRQYIKENEAFFTALSQQINRLLIDETGVSSHQTLFVIQGSLPRTSSGKIQRTRLPEMAGNGELSIVHNQMAEEQELNDFQLADFDWEPTSIKAYLENLICKKLRVADSQILSDHTLLELGMSSIKAVELTNQIRKELHLEIALEELFQLNHIDKITEYIIQLYWLQNSPTEGKEIEL